MSDRITIMEATACETVEHFAARMVVEAYRVGGVILGEHNEHTLEARRGMTTDEVLKPWSDALRASYFGADR